MRVEIGGIASVLLIGVSVGIPCGSLAEDSKTEVAITEARIGAERATEEVGKWQFRLPREPERELKINSKPILRWTNPAIGRVYGSVYVVTSDDCPQAIICPYKWFTPYASLDMECVSLTSNHIEGIRDRQTVWVTDQPGLGWKPVPGEPVVGKTNLERQRQIKKIAEEFTAELLDMRASDRGQDQQLRQMPQPVYRYESLKEHVLEGGIFAFVMGTDPELFLVLEARQTDGKSAWRYGLARMNTDRLAVSFQTKEVWQVGKISHEITKKGKQPYFSFNVAPK